MRLIDADKLLKAMDTWDKFKYSIRYGLERLYKDDKGFVPYVHYDDMLKAVNGMSTVDAIPKSEYKTDLKIILNRLKVRMKDRDEDNGGNPLNAVDRGYHLAYEHLCEEIDNLLKENEDGKEH